MENDCLFHLTHIGIKTPFFKLCFTYLHLVVRGEEKVLACEATWKMPGRPTWPKSYAYQSDIDPKDLSPWIHFSGLIIALGVRVDSPLKH